MVIHIYLFVPQAFDKRILYDIFNHFSEIIWKVHIDISLVTSCLINQYIFQKGFLIFATKMSCLFVYLFLL